MTRRIVTSSTALNTLLDRAESLLDDESPPPPMRRRAAPADPTGVLVEAGWFMLQQLQIALGLAMTDAEADQLVPDLLDRASAFGIASSSSVGAAASIVDRVRADDPVALARTIVGARGALDDAEIMAGVCALIAALSMQIAERMALDPFVVHRELSRCAPTNVDGCAAIPGGARSARHSTGRQPCDGSHARRRSYATTPIATLPR